MANVHRRVLIVEQCGRGLLIGNARAPRGLMGVVSRIVRPVVLAATLMTMACRPAVAVEASLVADAHVNIARPTANSGAISNLNVGGGYTTLLQFDLATLPSGTTSSQISRALLRLYCNRADTRGLVSVQPVSSAWGEYSVTYNTLPSLGAVSQVVSVAQAGVYVWVDVTSLVQWAVLAAQGQAGPAGAAGAQGPAGLVGPMGATGATGPQAPRLALAEDGCPRTRTQPVMQSAMGVEATSHW